MQSERFLDLAAHPHDGVQGSRWLLKNIADRAAPDAAQLFVSHLQDILTIEKDFTPRVAGWRNGHKARDRQRGKTFTATAFTYETKGFAGIQGKRDVVDSAHTLGSDDELDLKVFDFQQCHGGTVPSQDCPFALAAKELSGGLKNTMKAWKFRGTSAGLIVRRRTVGCWRMRWKQISLLLIGMMMAKASTAQNRN